MEWKKRIYESAFITNYISDYRKNIERLLSRSFQNLVGDAGFYIYQQVYPFILFFVVLISGGFAWRFLKMLADAELSPNAEWKKYIISQTVFLYLVDIIVVTFVSFYF